MTGTGVLMPDWPENFLCNACRGNPMGLPSLQTVDTVIETGCGDGCLMCQALLAQLMPALLEFDQQQHAVESAVASQRPGGPGEQRCSISQSRKDYIVKRD